MWRSALVCVALVALPSLAGAQLREALRRPLSARERARLEEGETVARAVTERRGPLRLMGGTSYQVIDAPPDVVWAHLNSDSDEYRHMLPKVEQVRELDRDGDRQRRIRFEHRVGPIRAHYVMRLTYDQERRVAQFRLDETEPHTIRAGWGFLRVRSWPGNRTLVSFGSLVDVGRGLVTDVIRPTLQYWILRIPWTLKRHVESQLRR